MSPVSIQISPTQEAQLDGFDFNSILPGMQDEHTALNVDYTALDDVEDGIEHWHRNQGPLLEETGSDQSEDTDVEMGSAIEPIQNGTQDIVDSDMADSGDKVCYGMVCPLSECDGCH